MEKEKFLDWFFSEVPELQEACEQRFLLFHIDRNDGIYVIWGLGIMKCILALLAEPEKNENILKKCFAFFEKMVDHDQRTKGLLFCSTFQSLNNAEHLLPAAFRFMEEKTLA